MDPEAREPEFDFLRVDDFLQGVVETRALATAFELGLIDLLLGWENPTREIVGHKLKLDRRGSDFLLGVLISNGVVEEQGDELRLTERFHAALRYRDLMEAKIEFAGLVAPDFLGLFTSAIRDPGRFMRESRLFELFNYQRCLDPSPENIELTRRWVRLTTILTRYEAQACLRYHRFDLSKKMLDIGGNSGEFALQVCKIHPQIQTTVFDLPVVCAIGQEHIQREPEADRITFIRGNAIRDPFPLNFDLITFKSMLHDWPEAEVDRFLVKAVASLEPGGTLLIFERGPVTPGSEPMPYSMLPMILFFRSFRSPLGYEARLRALGLLNIQIREILLEMPFFLVTATKPG